MRVHGEAGQQVQRCTAAYPGGATWWAVAVQDARNAERWFSTNVERHFRVASSEKVAVTREVPTATTPPTHTHSDTEWHEA